jgi:hypothetical protein
MSTSWYHLTPPITGLEISAGPIFTTIRLGTKSGAIGTLMLPNDEAREFLPSLRGSIVATISYSKDAANPHGKPKLYLHKLVDDYETLLISEHNEVLPHIDAVGPYLPRP